MDQGRCWASGTKNEGTQHTKKKNIVNKYSTVSNGDTNTNDTK
jgi:hypothetical protein